MAEPLFLGLDAGGSRTVCLLGDAHATLGRGEGGPANPSIGGVDGFRAAILEAAAGALHGRRHARVRSAWIGVAGAETPGMRSALRAAAAEALNVPQVIISHDARLLLAAAGVRSGIAVVAGTGSSVYGLAYDGREVTVGGWGHLLGDEGSAYDISRQALRAVTQAADGRGPATLLSEAVPEALAATTVQELRQRCYPAPPVAEVARLARLVLELADRDEVCAGLVAEAAAQLSLAVRTCRSRLAIADDVAVPVVLAGGLLKPGSMLLIRILDELHGSGKEYRVLPFEAEPAIGALALARAGPQAQEEDGVTRTGNHTPQLEERVR